MGCPAAQLGVDVPRGGPDAISQEDLQRDTFLFEDPALAGGRGPGQPGATLSAQRFEERLQQMHLLPAFGDGYRVPAGEGAWLICGRRDGKGDEGAVLVALDAGQGARAGAVPLAAAISVAKAYDVPAAPAHTVVICGGPSETSLAAYSANPPLPPERTRGLLIVGPLDTTAGVPEVGPEVGGVRSQRVRVALEEDIGDQADTVEFRGLVAPVRGLYGELEAMLSAPPRGPEPPR